MWTAVAVCLYLLPIAGFCLVRARPGRSPLGVALDLPLAVALDLLLVLTVSRVWVLDVASLVTRGIELLALGYWGYRRRALIRDALRAVRVAHVVPAVLSGALGLWLSTSISRPYAIWDRHWHIPLVASLRGQHAPFQNVYEPGSKLFYHYAGDAHAAIFQGLSFAHIHASAALSRAHDVSYALLGFFLGSALRALGVRSSALVLACVFCVLAGGPATLLFEGAHRSATGWSTINLLSLSFRPHQPLGFLFSCSMLIAGLGPLLARDFTVRWTALLPLASAAGALALCDEPTLAMCVGTVSLAWLVVTAADRARWRDAALVIAAVLLAIGVTVLVLGGTFGTGRPGAPISLVPARVPGFYLPSIPLAAEKGYETLFIDYLGPLGVLLAGLLSAIGRRDARGWWLFVSHLAMVAVSLGVLLRVQVNRDDMESHRAVTALLLFSPLFLMFWLNRLHPGALRSWVLCIGGGACLLGAVSTLEWQRGVIKIDAPRLKSFWGADNFYATDCVRSTGARLGERPAVVIGPQDGWYLFGGCRPTFAVPGGVPGGHSIVVGWPDAEASAFAKVDAWANDPKLARLAVRLFHPTSAAEGGAVVRKQRGCPTMAPAGQDFVACDLDIRRYREFRKRSPG